MNILVVDDEKDIQTLFLQRFRKETKVATFHFVFTFSGEEALAYLNTTDQEVVLILSDINMPGMTGLQLLKKVKEKFALPPPVVMMISAYGDQENYTEAMNLGADDFLTKPVDFVKLKEKLSGIKVWLNFDWENPIFIKAKMQLTFPPTVEKTSNEINYELRKQNSVLFWFPFDNRKLWQEL